MGFKTGLLQKIYGHGIMVHELSDNAWGLVEAHECLDVAVAVIGVTGHLLVGVGGVVCGGGTIVAFGLVECRGSEGPAAHLVVGLHGGLQEQTLLEGVTVHHDDVLSQTGADGGDLPLLGRLGEGWRHTIGVTKLFLKCRNHRRPKALSKLLI